MEESFGLILYNQNQELYNEQFKSENFGEKNIFEENVIPETPVQPKEVPTVIDDVYSNTQNSSDLSMPFSSSNTQSDVIIDYRAKFFEEQEKNEQLLIQIEELNKKIESIKKVIE